MSCLTQKNNHLTKLVYIDLTNLSVHNSEATVVEEDGGNGSYLILRGECLTDTLTSIIRFGYRNQWTFKVFEGDNRRGEGRGRRTFENKNVRQDKQKKKSKLAGEFFILRDLRTSKKGRL